MHRHFSRRKFLKSASIAGLGLGIAGTAAAGKYGGSKENPAPNRLTGKRVGLIGLDTSHSTAFTEALNNDNQDPAFKGYKMVAAYPWGSRDIQSSFERIPAYSDEVKKRGVEIVSSIPSLLEKVDVVLLETNDGRPHLQQAIEVMKAGKPLFVDKPIAGSLIDAIALFDAARKYQVPVFSASSLRYMNGMQEAADGKSVGKILGADAFSPAPFEPHHPDFYWYGIHGIETLYTLMGKGCKQLNRIYSESTDIVVGAWNDGRIGTFRGTRNGEHEYGATAFGEKGVVRIGPYSGYEGLLKQIILFFETGISPVSEEETLEIYTFMEAADESKRRGGSVVSLAEVFQNARGALPR